VWQTLHPETRDKPLELFIQYYYVPLRISFATFFCLGNIIGIYTSIEESVPLTVNGNIHDKPS